MQASTKPTLLQDADRVGVANVLAELITNAPSNQSKGGRCVTPTRLLEVRKKLSLQ